VPWKDGFIDGYAAMGAGAATIAPGGGGAGGRPGGGGGTPYGILGIGVYGACAIIPPPPCCRGPPMPMPAMGSGTPPTPSGPAVDGRVWGVS